MKRITLGILFGSRTCEHDVSIISGLQAVDAAIKAGYEVVPVYISRDGLWYTGDVLREIKTYQPFAPDNKAIQQVLLDTTPGCGELVAWPPRRALLSEPRQVVAHIDVFMPVMHGVNGEDGTLQGLLEMANVPYTSSGVLGSALAMDKIAMKYALRGAELPVLPSVWFTRGQWQQDSQAQIDRVEQTLQYPVYVKPANLGSSIGIGKGSDRETLREAIEVAASFDARILVEQGVREPQEINCSVLGVGGEVRPSPCEMPISSEEFLSFSDKYLSGSKSGVKGMESQARRLPAPIPDGQTRRIQQLACDAYVALAQRGVVRVDLMIDQQDGEIYINEVNSIPGSLAFYLWAEDGLSFGEMIDKMVEGALLDHAERNRSVYAYDSKILQSFAGGTKGGKG